MFAFGLTKSFERLPTSGSCISNTLIHGCVARYNTKVNENFFNRKRELVQFTNAFSSPMPMLHVVLGPPSTGKTALVHEITRKKIKGKDQFSPLFINCRKGQFDTPDRVYDSIYSQFSPFFDKHKDFLKRIVGGQFSIGDVGYRLGERGATTSNDVTRLLDNISTHLPNWSIWNGNNIPPPILVIDEANMFSQLAENDKNLLKSILNWLVVNTKEEKRFHTVLTSSDSFFFNWIVKLLHIPHATPYVVGDLSKEEAKKYFEMHILPQYECKELEGKFDQVCKITGTRMMIIEMYVNEYKNSEGKLAVNFSVRESEYNWLKRGLSPKTLAFKNEPDPPLWEAKDLIKTMDAIVKAEDQGYILADVLNKEIGEKKVESLIKYNYLHCRPTSRFANDIDVPPKKIVLTAMNQPSVCAMKDILEEEQQN